MSERVNAKLKTKLKKFGAEDWNECFHCGNCTATCPLTEDTSLFPRRVIRQVQLGLDDSLMSNVDPWMCYYCGDCTETCPRDANPGELMMSIRRYLTARYDWTGLAKQINTSKVFEIVSLLFIAIVVCFLYVKFTVYPSGEQAHWVGEDGGVLINSIADWKKIHVGDLVLAGILAFLLITNVLNMWYKVIFRDKTLKVPFSTYITGFFSMIVHFFTQKKFKDCDKNTRIYWFIHLLLMLSYVMLFTMIVVFLHWFQTDKVHEIWHPQRLLGYISTIGLLVGVIFFANNRIKKDKENGKYSHFTDWTFLILLFLTTVSGILLHFFRIWGMPVAVYYTYLIHLIILVPMLVIEVPFSKWSHLAYRPVAIYFSILIKAARKRQEEDKTNIVAA